MKSWARELAVGLLLSVAIPSVPLYAAQTAEQVLLDKANYWRLKDRPDLAIQALKQLLSINPNQPDALYEYGVLEVQQNRISIARQYLARLRSVAPSSPHVADLENAIRAGQVSPSELNQARQLAQRGEFAQAAKKYEQTFQGAPPPTFGVEYYMTLAGAPNGWDEARRGLEKLVQNSPNDSKAKLALAQVLTYHADTRARGIRMLEGLSGDPVVGQKAVQAWKQSLTWLGNGPQDREFYRQFLAKFPGDPDIERHMADVAKNAKGGAPGAPGPNATGYNDLNRGNLGAAERQFEAQLHRHPGDASALAGLGIIRLRQQRFEQARDLLGRAMRADPSQRRKLASAYASASFWATVNEAKAAMARGDYARAEATYRRVLASRPDDPDALTGLYNALTAEGKTAEAASLQARLATIAPGRLGGIARAKADILRSEADKLEARGDLAAAEAKYQEAIASDPNNAWARLDFARFLARRGQTAQAFQMVDPSASGDSADSYQAAAIFYSEQHRPGEALALLDRIPAGRRNSGVATMRSNLEVAGEIDRAKQLARGGNRAAAREVLLSLNSRPPTSAAKTRQIADALADIGDTQDAAQLARPSGAALNNPQATLDYASLLFRAGRDAEAVAYLKRAEHSGRITAGQVRELEHVKIDIAAKRADALRQRGDLAGAYDQISSLLMAYPNDPSLLLAAGRIYAQSGRNNTAMRFFDAAFRQAPGNVDVIRGAVGGAIMAGDLYRARAYLAQGLHEFPDNPRLYYLRAQIARADGNNGIAVYDLEVARQLDLRQGGSEPVPPAPATASSPYGALPPNPFRRSDASGSQPHFVLASSTDDGSGGETVGLPPPPPPLQDTVRSADSADLIVPPHLGERPPRPHPASATAESAEPTPGPGYQLADFPGPTDLGLGASDPAASPPPRPRRAPELAQLEPLPPPPIGDNVTAPPEPLAPAPRIAPASELAPLPPPPVAGYQAPSFGQATPVPQNSLELDIERSMAAINAEAGPVLQGGLAFRARSGETGLSELTEIGTPIEGIFSPFYTGTVRLQAVPTYLTAGTPASTSWVRFGSEPLVALANNSLAPSGLVPIGSQNAGGVSFNVAYAYQMFAGEIGSTPLGFPVTNLVGRLALQWPGPAGYTTAYPTIPAPPTGAVVHPLQVRVEGVRQPVTDSLLSYAGTRDPVSGLIWGGVVKTGGNLLVSYDDGLFGAYGGGGASFIDGKSVAGNSEIEGILGAYVRPFRTQHTAFKVGLNLNFMGYDKNLRFFTLGQGGYFSPQNYINVSVPLEYTGTYGRLSWLTGVAAGLQTFHEDRSPVFPTNAANQGALESVAPGLAFYPARNITGPAFFLNGQIEYKLDNGYSIGGLASVDNAQNYTEGIAKIYFRKHFGVTPAAAFLPGMSPGSL